MLSGKKILAIIPARGGSKGIPRKNLRTIAGKPLLAWSILEAKKSSLIDRVIVSSEDEEILALAASFGGDIPFARPRNLSLDDTPGVEPVLHALESLMDFDYVVVLQPTSPLRIVSDIDGSIEQAVSRQVPSVVTVSIPEKLPFWMCTVGPTGQLNYLFAEGEDTLRRQDAQEIYALNGAVFVAECNWFKKSKRLDSQESVCYVMPKERSIDIDDEMDLKVCEALLLDRSKEKGIQVKVTTAYEGVPKI